MSMEFLILQGNTQSVNTINYKIACTTMERRAIQEEITSVTEMMQAYEDDVDNLITRDKGNAKNKYDMSISQFQTETDEAKATQDAASTSLSTAKSTVSKCQKTFDDLEKQYNGAKAAKEKGVAVGDFDRIEREYNEAKEKLEQAKEAQQSAQDNYDNAVSIYSTISGKNSTAQKKAYTDYQVEIERIEENKKNLKSQATQAQKANLAQLNKEDSRLELSLNELNDMKEMLKAEKDSAKEATQQKAKDLAPQYG